MNLFTRRFPSKKRSQPLHNRTQNHQAALRGTKYRNASQPRTHRTPSRPHHLPQRRALAHGPQHDHEAPPPLTSNARLPSTPCRFEHRPTGSFVGRIFRESIMHSCASRRCRFRSWACTSAGTRPGCARERCNTEGFLSREAMRQASMSMQLSPFHELSPSRS